MFRQQHPSSAARHIPTSYDGRELGRDDPVWQYYVKEAEKWDNALVHGWNKGMDVLLLFAALFSAILTAFVIESYKSLQPDNSQATAAGIAQITELLQAIAAGERPSPRNSTSLPSTFQPTATAVVVNLAWFLSLSLSVLVTLVAMLVKQWGEGYRSGSGLTPPCAQARIRQSRFDKLRKWRTEDIVLVLPVVMHAALGLFLFGLLAFLWNLNHLVALPAMVVVSLTFTGYVLITFLPLLVAFCPYSTPLSSRLLWGYLYQRFLGGSAGPENSVPDTPCQREEKEVSDKNTPDQVTGRALDWLLMHSQDETVVDVAIRAIAGAELPKDVWGLLAQDSLIVLVAQKFTACFNGALDQEITTLELKDEQLSIASMYGRALTNIAKHKRRIDAEVIRGPSLGIGEGSTSEVPLTADQTQAVTRGLHYLACSETPDIAAFGIASVSAWYIFTGQARLRWKDTIVQSFKIVLEHVKGGTQVHHDALAGLIDSLPIEIACWKQDLSRGEKRDVLLPLVELLGLQDSWNESVREGVPLVLAVLAISVSDYPDFHTIDEARQWEQRYQAHQELVATHVEAAVVWHRGPTSHPSAFRAQQDSVNRAGWRMWRAKQAASIYTMDPDLRKDYTEALLLLGLAGLLDSLGPLGLENESSDIASAIAHQLSRTTILNKSQHISLPLVLPAAFDIRAYAVDCVIQRLRPSRYENRLDILNDGAKATLLAAFSEKHRVWVDFGAQLALPVIEMLHLTNNPQLQRQCLISMEEHSLTDPSLHEWQLFLCHAIPNKLVRIVQEDMADHPSRAISNFESFSQQLQINKEVKNLVSIAGIIRSLILDELFETLIIKLVCRGPAKHMKVWKDAILGLPELLASETPIGEADANCLAFMHRFCKEHAPTPGVDSKVNTLVSRLQNELDKHYGSSRAEEPAT